MEDRILRMADVCEMVGLSRVMVELKVKESVFPKPRMLTGRAKGWLLSDVQEWIAALPVSDADEK